MLLPPAQPCGRMIGTAQRSKPQRQPVDAEFDPLAIPALEDFQVHGHMAGRCNPHTAELSINAEDKGRERRRLRSRPPAAREYTPEVQSSSRRGAPRGIGMAA